MDSLHKFIANLMFGGLKNCIGPTRNTNLDNIYTEFYQVLVKSKEYLFHSSKTFVNAMISRNFHLFICLFIHV